MPDDPIILKTRETFERFIYTDFQTALSELTKRRQNLELKKRVKSLLPEGAPGPFAEGPRSVLFRQVATPNFETRRFLFLTSFTAPEPLLWEYHHDKFTAHNEMKKHLGKLPIITGYSKAGIQQTEYETIIDFNHYNGHTIAEIETLWGENLIDLHRKLFLESNVAHHKDVFFDASSWFQSHGGVACEYYANFLALFIRDGILFENFLYEDKHERKFLEEVILPAVRIVYDTTGEYPLIVALEPTAIEGELFWYSYPKEIGAYLKSKLH